MALSPDISRKLLDLARAVGHIFIATADREGRPHLGAAAELRLLDQGRLGVSAWFCPGTLRNLQDNPRLSLAIWDPLTDEGYQLLGRMEQIEETAIMDGYLPGEAQPPMPQVQRLLVIAVESVLHFSQAPHSDIEEPLNHSA